MAWLNMSLPSRAGTAVVTAPAFTDVDLFSGTFACLRVPVVFVTFVALAFFADMADLPDARLTTFRAPSFFAAFLVALAIFFLRPRPARFALNGASMFSDSAIVNPNC